MHLLWYIKEYTPTGSHIPDNPHNQQAKVIFDMIMKHLKTPLEWMYVMPITVDNALEAELEK